MFSDWATTAFGRAPARTTANIALLPLLFAGASGPGGGIKENNTDDDLSEFGLGGKCNAKKDLGRKVVDPSNAVA